MIPATYGYARVRKSDRDDRNPETGIHRLDLYGIRQDLIIAMTGLTGGCGNNGQVDCQQTSDLPQGLSIIV